MCLVWPTCVVGLQLAYRVVLLEFKDQHEDLIRTTAFECQHGRQEVNGIIYIVMCATLED